MYSLLWNFKYNEKESCPMIKENGDIFGRLLYGNACREHDKEGKETGRWLCKNYYEKHDPTSQYSILKLLIYSKTGNLNPNCNKAKGDRFEELNNRLHGFENINKKNNNFHSPIDSIDPKTMLRYQTKGAFYNSVNRYWSSNLENEHHKEFYSLTYYCASEDGMIIERSYEFPEYEVWKRKSIEIAKNPLGYRGIAWYEKYRVIDKEELKKINNTWQKILHEKINSR